jgi:hypothetical protein
MTNGQLYKMPILKREEILLDTKHSNYGTEVLLKI